MERNWAHAGIQEAAYAALAKGLAASELWSLLLGVAEQRAAQRSARMCCNNGKETVSYAQPMSISAR